MVGESYGKGITPELAKKLGVLQTAEGFEDGPTPDSPKKALRAADVPVEHKWQKIALHVIGDGKVGEDAKPAEPAGKWECMKMLFCLLMKLFGEDATQVTSSSGQFRAPDSGQFRGE